MSRLIIVGFTSCWAGGGLTVSSSIKSIVEAKITVGLRYCWKKYISIPPTVKARTYVATAVNAIPSTTKIEKVDRRGNTISKKVPKTKYPTNPVIVKTLIFSVMGVTRLKTGTKATPNSHRTMKYFIIVWFA